MKDIKIIKYVLTILVVLWFRKLHIFEIILGINFIINIALSAGGINKIENRSHGELTGIIEINNKKLEKIISNANMFFSIFLSDKIPNTRTGRLIAAKKYSGLSIVINNNDG